MTTIARLMDLDRKTVRRCLKDNVWQPYRRRVQVDTLLTAHAEWLRARAPEVAYSARILYQELDLATRFWGQLRDGETLRMRLLHDVEEVLFKKGRD